MELATRGRVVPNKIQVMQQTADSATAISAGGATIAWLEVTQGYVDLIAGGVAIVAGLFAIAHYVRAWLKERKVKNDSQ